MEDELRQYLDAISSRLGRIEGRLGTMEERFDALEARLVAKLDRAAEAFATEMGSLHTEIRGIDERQRRDAELMKTFIELVMKQTEWHRKSDNTIADLLARNTEFTRRLEELRGNH